MNTEDIYNIFLYVYCTENFAIIIRGSARNWLFTKYQYMENQVISKHVHLFAELPERIEQGKIFLKRSF